MSSSSYIHQQQSWCRIEFDEIVTSTQNFDKSSVISSSRGGEDAGNVYKGKLIYGGRPIVAAIKRLGRTSIQGQEEFLTEVNTISKLHHSNIVSLIGCCDHGKDKILLYEYVPNGTLDDHLHKHFTPLSWLRRLGICIDVARALSYLHRFDAGIIHGQLSSSHVLLNDNWVAKLSHVGFLDRNMLSDYVYACVIGNFAYLDPIYFETGKMRIKSDVYSFGVLLLELLCRKPVLSEHLYGEGMNLVIWAQKSIKAGKLMDIIDSDIARELSSKCLKKFISVAQGCFHDNPDLRPTMAKVVANLEAVLASQERFNASCRLRFGCL